MQAGYQQEVYVKTTDVVAVAGDKIDGILECAVTRTSDFVETTDTKAGTGYKTRSQALKDHNAKLSGQFESGDAVQGVLRTAYADGSTVYLTHHTDPSAGAGSKGFRYPMKVENYEATTPIDGIGTFSASLVGTGAPTAV